MRISLFKHIRVLFQATNLWQENYPILQELLNLRRLATTAILFMFFAAILEGFGIGFILSFLQSITTPQSEPIATKIAWFDTWILGTDAPVAERIYRVSALILLTTWLRSICNYLGQVYNQITQLNLADKLRRRLFERLQAFSLSYFTKQQSGDLVNTITNEIYQVTQAFNVISVVITKGLTFTVYLGSMFLLSWQLTLISILLFSLLSTGISVLLKRVRAASFDQTKAASWYTSVSLEFINGFRTIKAFAAQDFERQRFYDASRQLLQAATKSVSIIASVEPLSEGASSTMLIGMLVLAYAVLIQQGLLDSAALLTFLFVLLRVSPVLRQLDAARAQLSNFQGSLSQIKELLKPEAQPPIPTGKVQFAGLKQAIEFVSVSFGYEPPELVLQDITLTIKQGETTAIVGASGAGKSTLVDLVPRFYDPTQGKILIDGVDLRDLEINTLRRQLAVVSQDTFIFNTSVRDNIAYALETVDEAAIWQAARLANALEFIQNLPNGFDTQLGERGVRLSGGQRQRIAIARALLRHPEILILDEATSALDSESEQLIQVAIEQLAQGRTVIAIAHRLSTIVQADKVVVLEQGRIVEQGTYKQLLEQRGKLWKYHQLQYELDKLN